MKRKTASPETANNMAAAAALQSDAGFSKTRASKQIKTVEKDGQSSVIDFNRSRAKKDTATTTKTSAVIKVIKHDTQAVESQSERDTFARNFRVLRKEAGLSQRDIQKLTGIAQSHVSEIESAMHNICIETMVKLAKLVKRPIHELLKP